MGQDSAGSHVSFVSLSEYRWCFRARLLANDDGDILRLLEIERRYDVRPPRASLMSHWSWRPVSAGRTGAAAAPDGLRRNSAEWAPITVQFCRPNQSARATPRTNGAVNLRQMVLLLCRAAANKLPSDCIGVTDKQR